MSSDLTCVADFWDERFAPKRFAYGQAPNPFVAEQAHRFPPGTQALCLAEGEGRHAIFLAKQGLQVEALDASPAGLAKLRAWAEAEGLAIEAREGDMRHFPIPPGGYGLILNVFGHLSAADRPAFHAHLREAVAPGGWVLMVLFDPSQLGLSSGGPKALELLVGPEELRAAFEGWHLACAELRDMALDEGPLHQGPARVTCFLAQRPLG